MKRKTAVMLSAAVIFTVIMTAMSIGQAEVNVSIGINVPPRVYISSPPPLYVIPGTYAYFVPEVDVDILFYQDYWYRPHQGNWFRARSYNGPWAHIVPARVPGVLMKLPHDFRRVPPGHQRIPYGHFKKNWRTWEREKHWERRQWRHEERERHREDRRERREDRGRGRH